MKLTNVMTDLEKVTALIEASSNLWANLAIDLTPELARTTAAQNEELPRVKEALQAEYNNLERSIKNSQLQLESMAASMSQTECR